MKHLLIKNIFSYILLICMGIAMPGCEKDSDLKLPLAVNSNELNLAANGGSTLIMVYSTGKWTASFKEEVNWASIDKLEGEGNSSVTFSYSENLGVPRKVTLILSTGGKTQEIALVQAGTTPSLKFGNTKPEIAKNALPVQLELITANLKYNLGDIKASMLYDDELSEQWITDAKITKRGLEFYALENTTGAPRSVRITLTLIDGNHKEYTTFSDVKQMETGAFLTPEKVQTEATKLATTETVILQTNVNNSSVYFTTTVNYTSGGTDWISNVVVNGNTLTFDIAENETGASRNAVINLRLENSAGEVLNINYPVVQSEYNLEIISFAAIRALIPGATGEYTFAGDMKGLQGVIISDAGNLNMETNPQTTFNKIDWTENRKTAYIQALDGSYGFRIKTPTVDDNQFRRYRKVSLSLDGLTLVKESNPERYTIKGVTDEYVIETENGTSADVVSKVKAIKDLTDADMYTFVTLPNAEISLPYGSYTNTNWGYFVNDATLNPGGISNGGYVDAVPTSIRDNEGGHLNILTNCLAPWCRNPLPTGSGTISGILTHAKLKRFGAGEGNIGKYSIRVLEEAGINLSSPSKATTLVEWNGMTAGACAAGSISKTGTDVNSVIGTGALSCTYAAAGTGTGAHPICYSSPLDNNTKAPGTAITFSLVPNTKKWWDSANNKGEGFVCKFSTTGITGSNLTINFSQGGGSGSATTMCVPVYWQIEYSTDGTNYTVLPNSSYSVRPLTLWGGQQLYACPGLQDHSFSLPDALFNNANVWVKLAVAQDVCGSLTGGTGVNDGESGKISETTGTTAISVRLGVISFKYNQ